MWIRSASMTLGLLGVAGGLATPAMAQLRPEQVLVVYDSRISDSKAVAEYYAGSAAIPGGTQARPGTRRGVRVFDLASTALPAMTTPDIDRPTFKARLRDPLRTWLNTNDPSGQVRCLVMTRGLPFRLLNDGATSYVGDNPSLAGQFFTNAQYSAASVDSELTLLYQDLDGNPPTTTQPYANGAILNPYWAGAMSRGLTTVTYSVPPIGGWTTARRKAQRSFSILGGLPAGLWWGAVPLNSPNSTSAPSNAVLTPGDIYLVTRLDAATLAGTTAMLDRSLAISPNVNSVALVLDESGSDGVANTVDNAELDNSAYPGGITSPGYGGDDWEQAAGTLTADGRFAPSNVIYNAAGNNTGFVVGPNINYQGQGLVVSTPLLLLTHYGANSAGDAPGENTNPVAAQPARSSYVRSFNLAPGAAMNSMESYNGRCLGGLTPLVGQASIADFIDAGGTFAIGNVWEPFSMTIADSAQIVRNFYLGQLSWGEAAYTAVPFLSFQQIVIGDPLARVARSTEDRTADGRITIDDLYAYEAAPADLNRSGTITDADRQLVINAARASRDQDMRGAQRP